MKDAKPIKSHIVTTLQKERPFPELTNIPNDWYQKDHWVMNDKYEMAVAMIHDYRTINDIKFVVANKYTGRHEGNNTFPTRHQSLLSAIKHIEIKYTKNASEIKK